MAQSKLNSINYTFKMLYIIAIIMIIDGHIGQIDYLDLNGLLKYQNYHIALFCFTSGYFLNLHKTPKDYIISKLKRLILPLYIWNFIYGILCFLLNKYFDFNIGGNLSLYNLMYAPLVDGHQFIYNMASWFLIPLFLLQIISYTILKPITFYNQKILSTIFFISILILSTIILPNATEHNAKRDIMLLVYRTFYFFPSFAFGFLYRNLLEKYDTLNTPLYLFIILSLYTIIYSIFPNINHTPSWLNDIQAPILAVYALSFIAILFWLRIAKTLSFLVKQSKTLSIISNNTFDIMMHHFIGFMLIKAIISPFFADFNTHQFHHNIWYHYFPIAENLTQWIYIAITLVITLLIGFTTKRFYDIIKKVLGSKLL